jgi:hypothetical protein
MSRVDINKTLLAHLLTGLVGIEVATPNHTFTPDPKTHWARATFKYSNAEFGDTETDLEDGFLYVDIFCPLNAGTHTGLGHAETVRTLFRNQDIGGVVCSSVDIDEKGSDGAFYHIQAVVNFFNFVG